MGSDIAPEGARGRYFGVSRMVSETGSLSSPVSFAIFNAFASFGVAFVFMAGTAFSAGMIVTFVLKETLQRASQATKPSLLGDGKPQASPQPSSEGVPVGANDSQPSGSTDGEPPEAKEDAATGGRA
jgi:hypothetical protein